MGEVEYIGFYVSFAVFVDQWDRDSEEIDCSGGEKLGYVVSLTFPSKSHTEEKNTKIGRGTFFGEVK